MIAEFGVVLGSVAALGFTFLAGSHIALAAERKVYDMAYDALEAAMAAKDLATEKANHMAKLAAYAVLDELEAESHVREVMEHFGR